MSEQVIKNGNVMERSRTRTIAQVAMLGAVAGVLMNFEVPPISGTVLYQLDFSEIPALIGFFANGTCSRYTDRTGEDSGTSGNQEL